MSTVRTIKAKVVTIRHDNGISKCNIYFTCLSGYTILEPHRHMLSL